MRLFLVPFLFTFAIASNGTAQNALGSGNVLDNNLSKSSNINPVQDLPIGTLNTELRSTGVLQGRGFNEGIGRYGTAELQLINDAMASGDEKTYLDAINNSPWYWNNWDQQSTQFLIQGDRNYFNPTFLDEWSMSPKQMLRGRNIRAYSHEWDIENVRLENQRSDSNIPDEWSVRQITQYQISQALGNGVIQPTSADVEPLKIGAFRTVEETGYLTASPMLGVSIEKSNKPYRALGFSAWDAARTEEDLENGLLDESLVVAWRQDSQRLDQRVAETKSISTLQYDSILNTIAANSNELSSQEGVNVGTLNNMYGMLQNQLAGIDSEYIEENDFEQNINAADDAEKIDYLGSILRHGEKVTQFSGVQDTRFNELIKEGENALAKGEYFSAQKKFNQSLKFIPGHPLATAGLGHSNIGAGLYLSAGNVLQSLLSFQPEMIDVIYEPQLLPARIELVRAGVAIGQRLDQKRDGPTYAFLLAYIGHQLQDKEMLQQGLESLLLHAEKGDPFIPLLNSIWRD